MIVRFLEKNEYELTKELAVQAFGYSEEIDAYYKDEIYSNRVAVIEDENGIIAMAHLKRMIAYADIDEDESYLMWYVCYVATEENQRRKGYMDKLLNFVLDVLKKEGEIAAFLVPVDPKIYEHLGFTNNWEYNEEEQEMLYADDGLRECYAKLLNGNSFVMPKKLEKCENLRDIEYKDFNAEAASKYYDFFYIRPGKSSDTVPLDCVAYSDTIHSKYAIVDGRCLLMLDYSMEEPVGCIPFCAQSELAYYFKLQERFFNEVLNVPFKSIYSDEDAVKYLETAGILENYEIIENPEIYDYIYDAELMRTLAGRKLHKKRNLISQFERAYENRWEYRTLGYENRAEIFSFVKKWDESKETENASVNYVAKEMSTAETLAIDIHGTELILSNRELSEKCKIGGIYIDNELVAFSIGAYNPREKMAVICFEKAVPEIVGLYQIINREFLSHEFSDALIVNREDDVGLPGLRQAKLSYFPIEFSKKYLLKQKNF